MNHPHTATTGLTITYQCNGEALKLGYCHVVTIRSDESSIVELWWRDPAMPLRGGYP